jgi:hypothetical protein
MMAFTTTVEPWIRKEALLSGTAAFARLSWTPHADSSGVISAFQGHRVCVFIKENHVCERATAINPNVQSSLLR